MKIETVSIESLHLDPANVRRHPARNLDTIKASLARFGQQKPLVVDHKNVVRAGNGTLEAARALGWDKIRIVRTELVNSEATAFGIADNRSSELAEWDDVGLAETLRSLQSEDFDLDAIGFTDDEVDELVGGLGNSLLGEAAEETDPPSVDQAEELLAKWQVKPGDLWEIPSESVAGQSHRLLCGDSTKSEDVARVMGGLKAGLMNTDPPYGVKLDLTANHEASNAAKGITKTYRQFGDISNDELDGEELQAFLEAGIRAAVPHLVDNAAFYLWHPMLTQGTFFAAAAAAAEILIHRQIIWVKPHFIFGRGDYHWQHELCFYGWRRGNRPEFYGERNQSTTWQLDEGGGAIRKDQGHPTQKPVELFTRPILNHTKRGELVYEPFAGSGSQFVAAEQTGRICHGLEIAPKYCAVVLERLERLGLEPQRPSRKIASKCAATVSG